MALEMLAHLTSTDTEHHHQMVTTLTRVKSINIMAVNLRKMWSKRIQSRLSTDLSHYVHKTASTNWNAGQERSPSVGTQLYP